jgi:hypothetical protein
MKELLEKVTSYNLFNYLLPGTVFVAIAESATAYRFTQDNVILSAFVYYFIGLVISRVGAVVIEPLFKRIEFIVFADYSVFVAAAKNDPKVEVLSEQNNSYRTLCTLCVALATFKAIDMWVPKIPLGEGAMTVLGLVMLAGLFALAYRKQTAYIKKRVEL